LTSRPPAVSGPVVTSPVVTSPVVTSSAARGRALAAAGIAAAAAVAAGLSLGWAASGGLPADRADAGSGAVVLVGVLAVALAAANGYSKAYSP
jgi:hypothetical protein